MSEEKKEHKINIALGEQTTKGAMVTMEVDADSYKNNLPEDLTIETVKSVRAYDASYGSALLEETKKQTIEICKENKDIEKVLVKDNSFGGVRGYAANAIGIRTANSINPQTKEEIKGSGLRLDIKTPLVAKSKVREMKKEIFSALN